jgi:hypothetical protein
MKGWFRRPHKPNAAKSVLAEHMAVVHLKSVADMLESWKTNPEFLVVATNDKNAAREGWIETQYAPFQGWKMEPFVADSLDSIADVMTWVRASDLSVWNVPDPIAQAEQLSKLVMSILEGIVHVAKIRETLAELKAEKEEG